jgi:hypothetical protein
MHVEEKQKKNAVHGGVRLGWTSRPTGGEVDFFFEKGSFVLFNQRLFRTYGSPNYIRDNVKPAGPWVMFRRSSQHVSCHITTSIDMSKNKL